jgi:hypothetical protein
LINNPINITPASCLSLSNELANTGIQASNSTQGRRLSQRDFLSYSKSSSPNQFLEEISSWDVVLANGNYYYVIFINIIHLLLFFYMK